MDDSEWCRILLIDYDDDFLTRLKVLLNDEGYDAAAAWGGREARGLLHSRKFDVILLSDHLPDTNGRELCVFSENFLPMPNWPFCEVAIL